MTHNKVDKAPNYYNIAYKSQFNPYGQKLCSLNVRLQKYNKFPMFITKRDDIKRAIKVLNSTFLSFLILFS